MNGFDISSHQAGIDLSKIDCDFIITKATEGYYYTNPDFVRSFEQGIATGKRMGIYHYANGTDPIKEAKFFLKKIEPYLGKAILCLDWERSNNRSYGYNDADWCMRFMDYVYDTVGIKMFLYISAGLRNKFQKVLDKYYFWAAQYADFSPVYEFQEHPWNEGAYECEIRQYTSCFWMPNIWRSRLDTNKAYITPEQWDAMAALPMEEPEDPEQQEYTTDELAQQVLNGKWGNGGERRRLLEEAGYNYEEVQARVNAILDDENITRLAREVIAGKYGNGSERREKLGEMYQSVQKRVNQLLGYR